MKNLNVQVKETPKASSAAIIATPRVEIRVTNPVGGPKRGLNRKSYKIFEAHEGSVSPEDNPIVRSQEIVVILLVKLYRQSRPKLQCILEFLRLIQVAQILR